MKNLHRDYRLTSHLYLEEFKTLEILVGYYDLILKGVNQKITEDITNNIMKDNINPLVKTLAVLVADQVKSTNMFESDIKRLVYNAQFTNAYIKLENTLINICDDVEGLKKIKAKNEIHKMKLYLIHTKNLNLDTDEFKLLYDKIQCYREIRNAIIHLSLKFKKLKLKNDLLDRRLVFRLSEMYVNDSSYIVDFISDAKSFLQLIIDEHNRVHPPNVSK